MTATRDERLTIGWVIACYQFGYGLAAFGVASLRGAGLTPPAIYAGSAFVAALLGVVSLAIAHGRPSPASLHPHPVLNR